MRLPEALASILAKYNVDYAFTVPAEGILPILRGLLDVGIRVINARFEPSAGFMAIAYSRALLKPAIVIATAGPGILGLTSPIAQAYIEGDPLVVISISINDERGTAMHQFPRIDAQLNVAKPITKASLTIRSGDDVYQVMAKAFSIALSGKPGPVYVEVPSMLLSSEVNVGGGVGYVVERPEPKPEAVDEAADLLANAEYPVIIVGRGVYQSGACGLAVKLAEMLDAPIATTVMAKGTIPPSHRLYAGVAAGRAGNLVAYEVLRRSDVILAVGNRFSEIGTGRYSLEIRGKLIHVNVDDYDLGRAYKPYLAILSDAGAFLRALISKLSKMNIRRRDYVYRDLKELWALEERELSEYSKEASGPIKPWEVVRAVRDVLGRGRERVFIGDVGAHRIETFIMPIYEGERYITTTSYVSMGLAVPGAVAISVVKPDYESIAFVGDGGFLMTGLEVSTAVQYGAKPKVIVFNDSSYRVLGIYEKVRYGKYTDSLVKLSSVDFAALAKSLGADGFVIRDRGELRDLLMEALQSDRPTVVDVRVDPSSVPIPYQRLYGIKRI